LITDGIALVKFVLNDLKIPPEDIVILGQSLGTAVASAIALEFADAKNVLHPGRLLESEESPLLEESIAVTKPTLFAGIILVAPFSNLPSLMLTYRMGGIIPLLLPFRPIPALARMLTSRMVDKWPTADRLRAYYDVVATDSKLSDCVDRDGIGSVQIIHGINDRDISYHQTEMICTRVLGERQKCIDRKEGTTILELKKPGKPQFRFEIFGHGGKCHLGFVLEFSLIVFKPTTGLLHTVPSLQLL
jgi:pimeloyl-ACP methyl ester carboxylesterase